jgi:prepilin-type processing-associated H-X9-DG protein
MRRLIVGTVLILALGLAFVLFAGKPASEIAGRLLFGWWSYLARVVPRVSPSVDSVVTGIGCLILFTVGLHFFLRWFYTEMNKSYARSDRQATRWRPRWTVSIVGVVVLMFVAGMGAAGLAHQVGWLASSRRPHLVPRIESAQMFYLGTSHDHLKTIGLAVLDDINFESTPSPIKVDSQGHPLHSWQKAILPFLQMMPSGEIHDELPWNDPRNSAYFRGIVLPYLNPEIGTLRSPEGYALSHYAGNIHILGKEGGSLAGQGLNGLSNTIVAGEVSVGFKPWGDPSNLRDPTLGINRAPQGFGSPTAAGANFLFLDGSVRFVKDTIDPKVLEGLSHPGVKTSTLNAANKP